MKKLLVTVFATFLMTLSVTTHASENAFPAWICNLTFKGEAKGLQILIGAFSLKSIGVLTCVSPLEEVRTINVKIDMSSKVFAPRIGLGKFEIYGDAVQIALFNDEPEDLLGDYLVAQGQGSVIVGAGAVTAVHTHLPNLALTFSLQVLRGFGLNLGLTKMTIEAI
jgi:hypothetical protein